MLLYLVSRWPSSTGIGAGSKKGILFKGGLSIEGLSKLGAVIMDKTGTITEGNFQLQKVVATGKYTENELLSMCAGCEQNSTHPIANSIVAAAKEREIQFGKTDLPGRNFRSRDRCGNAGGKSSLRKIAS